MYVCMYVCIYIHNNSDLNSLYVIATPADSRGRKIWGTNCIVSIILILLVLFLLLLLALLYYYYYYYYHYYYYYYHYFYYFDPPPPGSYISKRGWNRGTINIFPRSQTMFKGFWVSCWFSRQFNFSFIPAVFAYIWVRTLTTLPSGVHKGGFSEGGFSN